MRSRKQAQGGRRARAGLGVLERRGAAGSFVSGWCGARRASEAGDRGRAAPPGARMGFEMRSRKQAQGGRRARAV